VENSTALFDNWDLSAEPDKVDVLVVFVLVVVVQACNLVILTALFLVEDQPRERQNGEYYLKEAMDENQKVMVAKD